MNARRKSFLCPVFHGRLTNRAVWLVFTATVSVATIGTARASCSQTPSSAIYSCHSGLCIATGEGSGTINCPNGTLGEIRECAENNYHIYLEQFNGPLTFEHISAGGELWWETQNGPYDAFVVLETAGQDCPELERNLGSQMCPSGGGPILGNPVNISTGNKYQREIDYQSAGPFALQFQRHFNIATAQTNWLGNRWTGTFSRNLVLQSTTTVKIFRDDGEVLYFQQCTGGWCSSADEPGTLTQTKDGSANTTGWVFKGDDDVTETPAPPARSAASSTRSRIP